MNKVFDLIQSDIDWRLYELKEYENIVKNLGSNDLKEGEYDTQVKIILKSAIPIIYAQWEGFVINSMKTVFQYLNGLKLNNEYYCCTYLTTAYEQTLKSLDDSSKFEKKKKNLTILYEKFGNDVTFTERIDTKSNLGFKVLTEICEKTNLTITSFKDYESDLNDLLNIRNSIAHGENSFLFERFSSIEKYITLLENLMLTFKGEIQNLLENEKYRKETI